MAHIKGGGGENEKMRNEEGGMRNKEKEQIVMSKVNTSPSYFVI